MKLHVLMIGLTISLFMWSVIFCAYILLGGPTP